MVKREEGALLQSIVLDREGEHGLSVQICAGLRELILGGALKVGERLPATRTLAQGEAIARIATPLLILATDADQLVSTPAIRRVAARLPSARLHIYGREAAHEILRELDPVRLDALARIDAFLDEAAR